jgi:hypothetical protein
LRLTESTTSSPKEDDDALALESWAGLASLPVEVEVDCHWRMKEAGTNYSAALPSFVHRRRC